MRSASWIGQSQVLLILYSRFLIEDMTQADLLAEDKAFEIYLKDNGGEDGMLENAEHKE